MTSEAKTKIDVFGILKKHILVDGFDMIISLQKSKGVWLYDLKRDKKYLDLMSFYASQPLGLNRDELLDPEFQKKLMYPAINKISNSDFYTEEYAEFVATLERVAMPSYFKYAFFISGGALAVENALKAAFDWKVRKNFAKGYKDEVGSKVIHFRQAFHGRSGYTLSLTNTADPRKYMYFPRFKDWPRITNPKITFPLEEHLEEVKSLEQKALSEINDAFEKHGDDIAAIIIEPIQGEGGDNHFRKEFFKELRRIADEKEVMLIYDEVQTGVGITGKMWYHEWLGEEGRPDIISFGKKMQTCGIFSTTRIDEVEKNVFHESSRINSTWGGNLVDMVRATKYLEIIEKENLVENARKQGEYLLKRLYELQEEFPELVSNARGKGLMAAFDLPDKDKRDELKKKIFDKGALILPTGEKGLRFRLVLDITADEIDLGMNIITEALKEMK